MHFSKLASQLFSPCFSTSMCDMRDRRVCPMLTLMWVIFIIDMRKLVIDLSAVFFSNFLKTHSTLCLHHSSLSLYASIFVFVVLFLSLYLFLFLYLYICGYRSLSLSYALFQSLSDTQFSFSLVLTFQCSISHYSSPYFVTLFLSETFFNLWA